MIISYSTAKELVELKIQRNNIFLELLNIENKIIKSDMVIKYKALTHNTNRIQLINEINEIEKKQMNEYSIDRETIINDKIKEISTPCDIENIRKEINDLKIEYIKLLEKINDINNKIPDKGIVTNFKLFQDDISCREDIRRT